jgi:hypothetical protein
VGYWLIANAVIVFLLVAHAMILATGLGYSVRIDRLMPFGVGLLAAGAFLPRGAFLPLLVTTLVIVAGIPIVMSYVLWRRERGRS